MDKMNSRRPEPEQYAPGGSLGKLKMPRAAGTVDAEADLEIELARRTDKIIGDLRESLRLPRGSGFLDDANAPPLDQKLIQGWVDRTLDPEQSAEVLRRSISYRSWWAALRETLVERTSGAENALQS
jgi:hypothetical protein